MKEENRKLLNSQMAKLAEEIETILDIKDRAEIRCKYIELLYDMSIGENITCKCNKDKDSIKEDIPKEVDDDEEEIVDEIEEEDEEVVEETEEDIEEDPLSDAEEVINILVKDECGEMQDVTDIYNQIDDIEDIETKKEAALCIKEYSNCIDEYKSLNMIQYSEAKLYIAFCIKEIGIESVNEYVSALTDGEFTDLYKYINDVNAQGFAGYMCGDDEEELDEE